MRLLNARTQHLETYPDHGFRPGYAILSHTWGEEEVSFQDVEAPSPPTHMLGYKKIIRTCHQALELGLDYVWVDTCCIDKTNPTELSVAINSMYQWYQDADVCFAYLSDVPFVPHDQESQARRFAESRWFQRGWTLQELLGPKRLIFFSDAWDGIGDRASLAPSISIATRIDAKFLGYNGREYLAEASIAEKMDWAATRKTIRIEDEAYCLLGIFGINMPLLYGEGRNAFLRLQEELIRRSDDQSIFAWGCNEDPELEPKGQGVLAGSPAAFLGCSWIEYRGRNNYREPFSLINTGISIKAPFSADYGQPGNPGWRMMLQCGPKDDPTSVLTLPINRIQDRGDFFSRRRPPITMPYSACVHWKPKSITLSVQHDSNSSRGRGLSSTPVWIKAIPPGFCFTEFYPPAKWSQARVVQVPAPGPSGLKPFCRIKHRDSGAEFTLVLISRPRSKYLPRTLGSQLPTPIKCILLPSTDEPEKCEVGASYCTWPGGKTLMFVKTSYNLTMDGPLLALSIEETDVKQRSWILVQNTLRQTVTNLIDIPNTLIGGLTEERGDLKGLGIVVVLLGPLSTSIEALGHPPPQVIRYFQQTPSLAHALLFSFVLKISFSLPAQRRGLLPLLFAAALLVVDAVLPSHHDIWPLRFLTLLALSWRFWSFVNSLVDFFI